MTPDPACALCPRLADFRAGNRLKHPDWHNAPVPSFGALDARLLIVGLAPGLQGANRTARPFTGDWAGDLLYATLKKFGLATGDYGESADDGFELRDCRVTNALRCVPPENKPTPAETRSCNSFLAAEIRAMPRLRAILCLGAVSHGATLAALGLKKSALPFGHGALAELQDGRLLAASYHCSRYNTNTGRLTASMFEAVFESLLARLGK